MRVDMRPARQATRAEFPHSRSESGRRRGVAEPLSRSGEQDVGRRDELLVHGNEHSRQATGAARIHWWYSCMASGVPGVVEGLEELRCDADGTEVVRLDQEHEAVKLCSATQLQAKSHHALNMVRF
jgi:hypothetical protein